MVETIRIQRLSAASILPAYAHEGDAGLDLCSVITANLEPGKWMKVPTGFAIQLPAGLEAQIRPRSGLAAKFGVTVLNSPGTVDAGYRGEIAVLLVNHGPAAFRIEVGMKIAQMVISEVRRVQLVEVPSLTQSGRGERGFGSSGL